MPACLGAGEARLGLFLQDVWERVPLCTRDSRGGQRLSSSRRAEMVVPRPHTSPSQVSGMKDERTPAREGVCWPLNTSGTLLGVIQNP